MELTKEQNEILNGILLGDGCLFVGKSNRYPLLTISRASKDLEYLKFQAGIFQDLCSKKLIILDNKFDKKNK